MSNKQSFYICRHCGNLIGMIHDAGVKIMCCGEKMDKLNENTVDAAREKHLPVVEVKGNNVNIRLGEADHPMTPEHYIMWVYLLTENGGQRKILSPDDAPCVSFSVTDDDKPTAVYAYCNLHSLWRTDI